jgi:hypothetical protein
MKSHKNIIQQKQQKIAQGNLVGGKKHENSLENIMKSHKGQKA